MQYVFFSVCNATNGSTFEEEPDEGPRRSRENRRSYIIRKVHSKYQVAFKVNFTNHEHKYQATSLRVHMSPHKNWTSKIMNLNVKCVATGPRKL